MRDGDGGDRFELEVDAVLHLLLCHSVEGGSALVHQEYLRVSDHRSRARQSLLLSTRKFGSLWADASLQILFNVIL